MNAGVMQVETGGWVRAGLRCTKQIPVSGNGTMNVDGCEGFRS